MTIDLRRRSIEIITANQAPTGAYIACPNMDDYAYSWFRDGAFIAYSMDLVGEHDSARRFYDWGAQVINGRADVVARALHKAARDEPLGPDDYLHTRYTLDGREGNDDSWPNFQLDGLGTWLWGLRQHLALTEQTALPGAWAQTVRLAADYLHGLWRQPNYDLWEEFGDQIHPYTLAAIYAGLRAAAALTNQPNYETRALNVRNFILSEGVRDGHFVKYLGSDAVDASLLGLSVPYAVVDPGDPRVQRTVQRIEAQLRPDGGGVQRYAHDSYYGGGQWLLLAAWLGWYHTCAGDPTRARSLLDWIAAQADAHGHLPEQIPQYLIAPDYYEKWVDWRGPIATPLLWSHAMYLVLEREIGD
ncbi:MAG TPA: glycoside hydrolase family 15 protein [Candidatus Sulfomarinibacteraceae bacterium]|nr:glycoside hydrolase family 15 protein [Candidatus Sulfomarinibacteraceae bacterium]